MRAAAGALALVVAQSAAAQAFPLKPLRFLMGFPAGGNVDTMGRPVAQRMAGLLGQPIVVDNHPGAVRRGTSDKPGSSFRRNTDSRASPGRP